MSDWLTPTDRALEVAAFLDLQPVGSTAEEIMQAVASRWPDLTRDEYLRALDLAIAAFKGAPGPTGLAA